MITFKLGFLLAFSQKLPTKRKKERKHDTKGKKRRKSSSSKKSKSSKKSNGANSKKTKRPRESVSSPEYVLNVGKPIGYASIEYELLPNRRPAQRIDVTCWKGVARVYAGEDTLTYRVKFTEDTVWVPIFIRNIVNQLSVEELQSLHRHEITFHIRTSKNKVAAKARNDKTKLFFMRTGDTSATDITVPVFSENPNKVQVHTTESKPTISYCHAVIKDCINAPGRNNWNEIVVTANLSDPVHSFCINKIINRIPDNQKMFFKEFIPVSPPPETPAVASTKGKGRHGSKSDKQSKEKGKNQKDNPFTSPQKKDNNPKFLKKHSKPISNIPDVVQIKVSGEIFFTDPALSMYDAKYTNSKISSAYVLLSVENLMTVEQSIYLNPMTVKVEKLDKLDDAILKTKKFKSIFVRYSVPYVAQATTQSRDIEQKIRYNEAHAHFTHMVPEIKLMEFLQSNKFVLEICGIRDDDVEPEIHPLIFGSAEADQYFDRKMTADRCVVNLQRALDEACPTMEVLAVATYDLTTLLWPAWKYSSTEICHNPGLLRDRKSYYEEFEEPFRAHNINLRPLFKEKNRSPLTEFSLLEKGTCLTVHVSFASPITYRTKDLKEGLACHSQYYNRILLIVYSSNIASSLLKDVLVRNQELNECAAIPNLFGAPDPVDINYYLTGFVIDNGNTFAFFLEGKHPEVEKVWKRFNRSSPDHVTVYFNSNNVFETRLYQKFLKLRGLCVITLHKPLRDILSQELFYVEGYVPFPSCEAIKKLDLLFRSTSLKSIMQDNLLPTPYELLSVDLEYGTAIRWNDSLYKSNK